MTNSITEHMDIWTAAQTPKTNGSRGRGNSSNGQSVYGIKKLRELILQLAVRGKLVAQDPCDEPASLLLEKIAKEKMRLVKEGKIKKEKPLSEIGEDEKPFEVPVGWEWVRLGIALKKITDGTHHSPPNSENGEFLYISAKNIKPEGVLLSNATYITKDIHNEIFSRCNPEYGDILYIKDGATTGVTTINNLEEPFSMLSSVALLKAPKKILNTYLLLSLRAPYFYEEMRSGMTGVAITRVTLTKLNYACFSLPPLAEQHRIVAKVDELMALCDQLEQQQIESSYTHQALVETLLSSLTYTADQKECAKAWQRMTSHFDNLFTTGQSIDQLKQTILQLAVMGKLVPQDPNDEPASVLLEKIAKEKKRLIKEGKIKKEKPLPKISEDEKPFELPEGWRFSRLCEFTVVGTGTTPARSNSDYYFPEEINWVTSGETSDDFITETREKISLLAVSETNITVYPIGTLIVAMYGQGKTRGQVSELLVKAGTNQACAAVQPVAGEEHHRKYIKLFFKKAYEELRSHAAGGAQPNLNVGKIAQTVIPIPPLAEQHRIVAKVDELMVICDTLKARLNDAQTTQIQLADAIVEQGGGIMRTGRSGKCYDS